MILEVENLSYSYGNKRVLDDIGFSAKEGEVVSILGRNGVGKTTFLKCLNKILLPEKGTVKICGKDILPMGQNEIAKLVSYVPQNGNRNGSTVFESVLIGRKPYIGYDITDRDIRIAGKVTEFMGLSDIADKKLTEISGGEFQLVMIARALAQQPKLILLDEPTSNLDLKNQNSVMEKIAGVVHENKMCAIIINHHLDLSFRYSDRFMLMSNGGIFASGDKSVITAENISKIYGIPVDVFSHGDMKFISPR